MVILSCNSATLACVFLLTRLVAGSSVSTPRKHTDSLHDQLEELVGSELGVEFVERPANLRESLGVDVRGCYEYSH